MRALLRCCSIVRLCGGAGVRERERVFVRKSKRADDSVRSNKISYYYYNVIRIRDRERAISSDTTATEAVN